MVDARRPHRLDGPSEAGAFPLLQTLDGSVHDGGDAVQNTLRKTVQSFPGFILLVDLKVWLFRLAHHAAIGFALIIELAPFQSPVPGADAHS
jgi:hypothetical protein